MRLHCENDNDDVDEDYDNNGLRSPKNLQYETVYFKKLHKDRAELELLQCQLLQVCTSFSHIKVSLAQLFRVLCRQKANPYLCVFKLAGLRKRRHRKGVVRKLIWKYSGTSA